MNFILEWIIWMIIAQQIYQLTDKHPELFKTVELWVTVCIICFPTITIFVRTGMWFSNKQIEGKIKALEEQIKLEGKRVELAEANYNNEKNKREEIEEKYKALENQYSKAEETESLSESENESLKIIQKYGDERENVDELPQCSVEEVEKELEKKFGRQINANEIIKKLKRLGLVESLFENTNTWADLSKPINRQKAVRITIKGEGVLLKNIPKIVKDCLDNR